MRVEVLIATISAFVFFVLFAPVVPMMHSIPVGASPPSTPFAFHGSISRATAGFGLEIDGTGAAHFRV